MAKRAKMTDGLPMEQKSELDDLARLLDEMLAESGGPLTPDEEAAADSALGR